jgi:hypothetical protein
MQKKHSEIGKKSNKKSGMRKKHFLNLEKNPILIRLFTSQKRKWHLSTQKSAIAIFCKF